MGIIASAYGGPLAEFPLEDGHNRSFFVRQQAINLRICVLNCYALFCSVTSSVKH